MCQEGPAQVAHIQYTACRSQHHAASYNGNGLTFTGHFCNPDEIAIAPTLVYFEDAGACSRMRGDEKLLPDQSVGQP